MIRRSVLAVAVAGLAACGGGSTAPDPVTNVTVAAPASTLVAGRTMQLSATALNASGSVLTGRAIAWSSSNQSLATVSPSGLVTAVGEGSVTISAVADGQSGAITLATRYPYPNVSGFYTGAMSFIDIPRGSYTAAATVTLSQPDRMTGTLTGDASAAVTIGGTSSSLRGLYDATVDTLGQVRFYLGAPKTNVTTWTFLGIYNANNGTILGNHALGTVGQAPITGGFSLVRASSNVQILAQGAAVRPDDLLSLLGRPLGK